MHVLRVDLDDIADLSAVELRVTAGGIADAVVIIPAAGRSRDEHVILGGAVGIVHGRFAGRPVIDRVNVVLDPGELAAVGTVQAVLPLLKLLAAALEKDHPGPRRY